MVRLPTAPRMLGYLSDIGEQAPVDHEVPFFRPEFLAILHGACLTLAGIQFCLHVDEALLENAEIRTGYHIGTVGRLFSLRRRRDMPHSYHGLRNIVVILIKYVV